MIQLLNQMQKKFLFEKPSKILSLHSKISYNNLISDV